MLIVAILYCSMPLIILWIGISVVQTVENIVRGINTLDSWEYKFKDAQLTKTPRSIQSRVQELESLGFRFIGQYWVEMPVKIGAFSGTSYALLDDQRSVLAAINVRRILLMDHVFPMFLTFYNDGFFTGSVFRLPYNYFMLFKRIGSVELTMSRGLAAPSYAQHKERVAEALKDQQRGVITMNSEQEVIDAIKEHNNSYVAISLSKRLRIIMIFFLCIFGLLDIFSLNIISRFSDPTLSTSIHLFNAALMVSHWSISIYLAVRMYLLRGLLFGERPANP